MTLTNGETAGGALSPGFLSMVWHRFDLFLDNLVPAPLIFLILIGLLVWCFPEVTRQGRLI